MDSTKTAVVLLAGGRSSRMGGGRKALADLAGRSLLAHVVERVAPQVDTVLLSCEGETSDFDQFGLTVVPDLVPGHRGPLAGLYSAMKLLSDSGQTDHIVLCPCDAPFVPLNLVQALLDAGQDGRVAVVAWHGVLQPTFSLWQIHHLELIRDAVLERGLGGPRQVLGRVPHELVEWPDAEPPPFFNINTPQDMETAARWLDRTGG